MAEKTPVCDFGWKAPAFTLPGIDGKVHSLEGLRGPKGTLVMFICNHCPYVKAVIDRIVRDADALKAHGVSAVAILRKLRRALPGGLLRQHEAFRSGPSFRLSLSL